MPIKQDDKLLFIVGDKRIPVVAVSNEKDGKVQIRQHDKDVSTCSVSDLIPDESTEDSE